MQLAGTCRSSAAPQADPAPLCYCLALHVCSGETFGQVGLLLPQDNRAVQLHATIVNTRYCRRSGGSSRSGPGGQKQQERQGYYQRQEFDRRQLLERHVGVDLGQWCCLWCT